MKRNKVWQVILDDLREHPESTRQEIALRTGFSYPCVWRWLKKMRREIVHHGGWPRTFSARGEK